MKSKIKDSSLIFQIFLSVLAFIYTISGLVQGKEIISNNLTEVLLDCGIDTSNVRSVLENQENQLSERLDLEILLTPMIKSDEQEINFSEFYFIGSVFLNSGEESLGEMPIVLYYSSSNRVVAIIYKNSLEGESCGVFNVHPLS